MDDCTTCPLNDTDCTSLDCPSQCPCYPCVDVAQYGDIMCKNCAGPNHDRR